MIVIVMHTRGINCRYMGRLRSNCTSPYWRLQLLLNMCVRRLKRLCMMGMRQNHLANYGISVILGQVVEFFNSVLGSSSVVLWETLKDDLQGYFGHQIDLDGVKSLKDFVFNEANDRLLGESTALRLFKELNKKLLFTAEQWDHSIQFYTSQPELLTMTSRPFNLGDLKELPVEVMHLPIKLVAQAKIKQLLAMDSYGSRAFFLNWSAASKFVAALDVLTTKEIMRNVGCTLGQINAISAAREYFEMAVAMDPTRTDQRTLFKFANFCDASYQTEEAEELYLESVENNAPFPVVNRLCVYADFLLTDRRNTSSAIEMYEACLHLDPFHAEAAHNLALVLSKRDPARAAALFTTSLDATRGVNERSYQRCARNAAHFFEVNLERDRAIQLHLEIDDSAENVARCSPLLYHATNSDVEFQEISNILGSSRRFKISQLRLKISHPTMPSTASLREVAIQKTKTIYHRISYPVSTEIVYIKPGDNDAILGKDFDEMGPKLFVERYGVGTTCRVGVWVAFTSNGENFFVTESSIVGTLVGGEPYDSGFGWDSIFALQEFGKTLLEISDVNLKDYISFRRLSYLKLWLANFANE